MKEIILSLCLMFFCSTVWGATYIYTGDNPKRERSLPNHWTMLGGGKTGNFSIMPAAILIAEGWREITVKNNEAYDREIQARTLEPSNIIIHPDNTAEVTYTITDKNLNAYRKATGRRIRAEAVAVLNAKYTDPLQDGYGTALNALRVFIKNTIKPLVTDPSATLQTLKNLNNGDEYTLPTL